MAATRSAEGAAIVWALEGCALNDWRVNWRGAETDVLLHFNARFSQNTVRVLFSKSDYPEVPWHH